MHRARHLVRCFAEMGGVHGKLASCRLKALEWGIGMHVSRVPSKENLADDPSREKYDLLRGLSATWREPHLCPAFVAPQTWEALSIMCK